MIDSARAAVIHARSPQSPYSALKLPVTLATSRPLLPSPALVDMRAMVDSGASCCFIHPQFVAEQGITTVRKRHPMRLRTIDNSEIRLGLITDEVHLRVTIGEHTKMLVLDVVDIGDDNFILGMSWLRTHNPGVDWSCSTVRFESAYCWQSCMPPGRAAWARQLVPKEHCWGLKLAKTRWTKFWCRQKRAAVKAACAKIKEALESTGDGGEAYLEQRWDLELVRSTGGPCLVPVGV